MTLARRKQGARRRGQRRHGRRARARRAASERALRHRAAADHHRRPAAARDPRHQGGAHRHLRHRQDQRSSGPSMPQRTLFLNLEAGELAVQGWPGDEVRIRDWERRPRPRLLDRRPQPGDARRPALRPEGLRAGLRRLRRRPSSRQVRDDLRRLDLGRLPHLPAVVQGPAAGDRPTGTASPTCAAPTGCSARR